MMPRIFTPVFLQKVISRLTSPVDTACSQYTRKRRYLWEFDLSVPMEDSRIFFVCVQDYAYLRCGDQDGSIYLAVLLHVLQHCQMFVRCSWWCVYQQHIQLPPCNIWHELANQSCWVCKKRESYRKYNMQDYRILPGILPLGERPTCFLRTPPHHCFIWVF